MNNPDAGLFRPFISSSAASTSSIMEIDAVSAPVHIQEAIGEEEERRALIDVEPGVEYGTMGSSNGESILHVHKSLPGVGAQHSSQVISRSQTPILTLRRESNTTFHP